MGMAWSGGLAPLWRDFNYIQSGCALHGLVIRAGRGVTWPSTEPDVASTA